MDVPYAHVDGHAIDVVERQRVTVEACGVEARERIQRVNRPRGLAIVLGFHVERQLAQPIRPRHCARDHSGRGVDLHEVSREARRTLGALLFVCELDLRLRRRIAGVVHLDLAWLARPIRVNDRKDLAGRRQPPPRGRAAQRVEEVERHEVQILMQRFQRGHHLFIDANPEIGLAHPHFDVEIAMEWLLVRQRTILGDLHHVVVDARQHLRLVVIPEALGIGGDPPVDNRSTVNRR